VTGNYPEAKALAGAAKARDIEFIVLANVSGDPVVERAWSAIARVVKRWSAMILPTI
jgi:hypothetical protein